MFLYVCSFVLFVFLLVYVVLFNLLVGWLVYVGFVLLPPLRWLTHVDSNRVATESVTALLYGSPYVNLPSKADIVSLNSNFSNTYIIHHNPTYIDS